MNLIATVFQKLSYSWAGVKTTFRDEPSMRQWFMLVVLSDGLALIFWHLDPMVGVIFATGFLLLGSELINTAVEIVVDYVHPEYGDAAKRAKDAASALTLMTFCALLSVWVFCILGKFPEILTKYNL